MSIEIFASKLLVVMETYRRLSYTVLSCIVSCVRISKSEKHDFLRFFSCLHTFSRTLVMVRAACKVNGFEFRVCYFVFLLYFTFNLTTVLIHFFRGSVRVSRVKLRLHDTAGCQTGYTTGLTTGYIV